MLGQHRLVHRPVAPAREALLRRVRQDVVEELLGLLRRVLGRRDVDVDLDRVVRDDVVEVLALLVGGRRLVLVGEEDVRVTRGEVLQRLATGLVLHLHVLREQLAHVGQTRLGVLAAVGCLPVGGEQVPLRGAGRERVGREDLDARLEQVVPRLDVLGVALADDERHDRRGHEALVGTRVPVVGDEAGLHQPRHVGLGGERHDVGLLACFDRAALVAGRAVGPLDLGALALRGLLEVGDDLVVDDLRGRVRDEVQASRRRSRSTLPSSCCCRPSRRTAHRTRRHPRGRARARR